MDLWNTYAKESEEAGFETKRLDLRTGSRWNASIGQIEDRSLDLKHNQVRMLKYTERERYMLAREISHDLLVSVYDVDTRKLICGRITSMLSKDDAVRIAAMALGEHMHNTEMRVIGMQSGNIELVSSIELLHKELRCRLIEVDLFGGEIRHIAIDTKTGLSYNLLLLNRIYRPGELVNIIAPQDFEALKLSKLDFGDRPVNRPIAGKRAPLKGH